MGRKISVIVPTLRRGDLLRDCLESLQRQTFSDFEIILVSDGAGAWAAEISQTYNCRLLNLASTKGFAAAINAGVAASDSTYIALLNDDVRLDGDWLQVTSSFLSERPEAAFCCGKIFTADGTMLDNVGDALSLAGSAWRLGHGRADTQGFDSIRRICAFPGTAVLLRREIFQQLGGFDENFIAYLEDVDLSIRLARRGHQGFYIPEAKSLHWGGATSGGPESGGVYRLLTRNQLLILAKHYSWPLWPRLLPRILWAQLLWLAMLLWKRRFWAYLMGVVGFLRSFPNVFSKRIRWTTAEASEFIARLRESEAEIYADVCAPDRVSAGTFWKMYFFLFRPRATETAPAKSGLGRLPLR